MNNSMNNNGVNNNGVENNFEGVVNMNNLTVKELREMAKEMGLTGISKLRKAELIEVVTKAKEEAIVMEAKAEVITNVKGNKGMNRINFETLRQMKSNGSTNEQIHQSIKSMVSRVRKTSKLRFNIIKKASKNIRVINTLRIEYDVVYKVVGKERVPQLDVNVFVQPSQESALLRQCNIKKGKLADSVMVSEGLYVDEIINVGFTNNILKKNPKIKTIFEATINGLINNGVVNKFEDKFKIEFETPCLIFNTTTGVVRYSSTKNVQLRDDEYLLSYAFMGITPSGLRSASLLAAAIERVDNKTAINCDRREMLLERAMDGAFVCNFKNEDGTFKTVNKLDKLFKDSTRITQCAPGSQDLFKVRNYIIVNNIAERATFNGVLADQVTDGNILVATESLIDKYYRPNNIEAQFADVNGTCAQGRGASLKCSYTATKRKFLALEAKHVMTETNFAWKDANGKFVGAFAVVDGKKMKPEDFNALSEDKKAEFFRNIDMLGDLNAFKLGQFNPEFTLVKLKEAYASDSKTNMVVNMAMLQVAPEEAKAFLIKRAKEQLIEHFRSLGVKFSINENDEIIPERLDFSIIKSLNNSAQFIDYIYKCDAATISALLPGAIRSIISNSIKGLRRVVNELKIDLNSKYMVVQSDRAAIFQRTVLQENEIYCKDFDIEKVSAVRHPISSTFAVSSFNVVGLEEIAMRIQNLELGVAQKEAIFSFYASAKGYVILPASHYLMEKHDGMDWDIDAMQFILDQEAVSILSRIKNIGSKIDSDCDWMRKVTLKAEENINEKNFVRPENDFKAPETKQSKVTTTAAAFNQVSPDSEYEYNFFTVGEYVAKDFFLLDVANVGQIATAFYNNVCILSALKSKETEEEYKDAIVDEFKYYYGCRGKKEYTAVVDDSNKQYHSNKSDCCEAIFRFAESNGTQAELEAFLLDCCYLNRFVAETSIDAAKNRFFIYNMFNHAKIVRAAGSDKNMTINVCIDNQKSDKIFLESFNRLGLSNTSLDSNNFFNIDLLDVALKGEPLETLESARAEAQVVAMLNGREPKDIALSVLDPLAKIRLDLMEFSNDLIVLTSKLLESHVNSLESKKLRSKVQEEANAVLYGSHQQYHINAVLYAIKNAYATITSSAKNTDEFEGKAAKEYLNTVAIQGCRNMAKIALGDVDPYIVGLCVVATMSKEDGTSTINPALFKVFEREIVTFLSVKGINNMGFVGEEVMYIKDENGIVDSHNFIGESVEINHGVGELENGAIVYTTNKRANIAGVIIEDEGKIVIKAERVYAEDNIRVGAYFNLDTRNSNSSIIGRTNCNGQFIPVAFEIRRKMQISGKRYFNVVIAHNQEGQQKIEGCITANENIINILAEMNLTPKNFSVFTSAKGSKVFFLAGEECEMILDILNSQQEEMVDDIFKGEFFTPVSDDEIFDNGYSSEDEFGDFEDMQKIADELGLADPEFA